MNHSARSGGIIGIYFDVLKHGRYVVCSHKNHLIEAILMSTHNIHVPLSIYAQKNTRNCPKSAAMRFFPNGLINEFETAVANGSSVFEPLKFYCIYMCL